MILATIGVGLLTAYYYGVQAGIWAGAATLALMLVATVVPDASPYAYAALAVGVAAIAYTGPKLRRPGSGGFVALGKGLAKRYGDGLFANKKRKL